MRIPQWNSSEFPTKPLSEFCNVSQTLWMSRYIADSFSFPYSLHREHLSVLLSPLRDELKILLLDTRPLQCPPSHVLLQRES